MSWDSHYDDWKLMDSESYSRKRVFHCEDCDEGICDGEEYIHIHGMNYCMSCIERNYRELTDEEKEYTCDYCKNQIEDSHYYAIHALIICPKCMQDEKHIASIEDTCPN